MPSELLSERRGFFARLPNPPRLDARALFWWGIALAAIHVAWDVFASAFASDNGPQALFDLPLSGLFLSAGFILGQLGLVLIAVALGARTISLDADRGSTAHLNEGRRFLTALPRPPRLDARALLWWGTGLIAIGLAWGRFLPGLVMKLGVPLYQNLAFRVLDDAISTTTMLGSALVAVALGVRTLSRDGAQGLPRDSEHEPAVSDD